MASTIVTYGGGFQPFHQGHMSSYVQAKTAFPGADFFVVASNDTKVRPIPFDDKRFLAQQAGVKDPFIQVVAPINPKEILTQYDPNQDVFIMVRSERDPVGYSKKDGSPGYFQPFVSIDKCEPFSKHGYVFVTKKHVFNIGGLEIFSGSQVRGLYAKANEPGKAELINGLYPKSPNKQKIKQIFDKYLSLAEGIKYLRSRVLKEGTLEQKLRMEMIVNDLDKEYTVSDFKVRCFESWTDYSRFLMSPKNGPRDTVRTWPAGVASFLSPSKTELLAESVLSQQDRHRAKKFSDDFKALDKRDQVKIKVGNSLAVLYTIINLDKKEVELGGFANPKLIKHINVDPDGTIDTITFDDGSQFPERNELTNIGGLNITNTIFFPDQSSAASAYTKIWMLANTLEAHSWTINHQSLSENNMREHEITEGIFDRFKKKPVAKPTRMDITPEQRAIISKYFPSNNSGEKWGGADSKYVLPDSVRAEFGRGIIHFLNIDGKLTTSVAYHRSKEDRINPRASPLTHFDHDINGEADMVKLKDMISESKALQYSGQIEDPEERARITDLKTLYGTFGGAEGIRRARHFERTGLLKCSKQELALLDRMTDERGNILPRTGPEIAEGEHSATPVKPFSQVKQFPLDALLTGQGSGSELKASPDYRRDQRRNKQAAATQAATAARVKAGYKTDSDEGDWDTINEDIQRRLLDAATRAGLNLGR